MKSLGPKDSIETADRARLATKRRTMLLGSGAMTMYAALPAVGCGASGVIASGSTTSGSVIKEEPHTPTLPAQVPRRPFGRSGVEVSSIGLGGYFDALANQALLDLALERGITYWECTSKWGGRGYGKYFQDHPDARERVFLLSKTTGASLEQMEIDLASALEETKTSYIDFFVLQSISDSSLFTDDVRRWVEAAKENGRIRYFGFSTHANMEACLRDASLTDWIDGAVTTYNYRLMHLPAMKKAVDDCAKKGIAVTAIKSQAMDTNPAATIGEETSAAKKRLKEFMAQARDPFEARIQAVLKNPQISSVLSLMTNPGMLQRNALAASAARGAAGNGLATELDRRSSAGRYCTGCANICEGALSADVPIADVMRYLMYARSYGDTGRARRSFAAIPPSARAIMATGEGFALAEERCPQRLPIGRLMAEAVRELG